MPGTETTPLLIGGEGAGQTTNGGRRRRVKPFAILALTGFLSAWTFWMYYYDMPILILLEDSEPSVIQIFINDFVLFLSSTIRVLVASAYSTSYGKRSSLLGCVALITIGSGLLASAQTYNWLILGRFLQNLGTPAMWSLSLGILADNYGVGERGKVVGGYAAAMALGAAATPHISYLVNGMSFHVSQIPGLASWRINQGLLGVSAAVLWPVVLLFVGEPSWEDNTAARDDNETYHNGNENGNETVQSDSQVSQEARQASQVNHQTSQSLPLLVNPFSGFKLIGALRLTPLSFASGWPIYSAVALVSTQVYILAYTTLPTPRVPYIEQYVYRRFLTAGMIGIACGSVVSGALWDRATTTRPLSSAQSEPTERTPARLATRDNRLVQTAVPGGLLVSLSTLGMGYLVQYAAGIETRWTVGVVFVGILAGLGVVGAAAASVTIPSTLYFLQVTPPKQNAQVVAANDALHVVLSLIAFVSLGIFLWEPLVSNEVAAGVGLLSPLLVVTVVWRRRRVANTTDSV